MQGTFNSVVYWCSNHHRLLLLLLKKTRHLLSLGPSTSHTSSKLLLGLQAPLTKVTTQLGSQHRQFSQRSSSSCCWCPLADVKEPTGEGINKQYKIGTDNAFGLFSRRRRPKLNMRSLYINTVNACPDVERKLAGEEEEDGMDYCKPTSTGMRADRSFSNHLTKFHACWLQRHRLRYFKTSTHDVGWQAQLSGPWRDSGTISAHALHWRPFCSTVRMQFLTAVDVWDRRLR